MQIIFDFTSPSPINTDRLSGQNLRLFEYLKTGNPIHVFHPAKRELKIGYLNSRASDLINKYHVPVSKERIQVVDTDGELVSVVEYSIKKENL